MQVSGLLNASNVSLRFEERIDVDALNALCKHDDVDMATKKLLGKIRKAVVRGNVVPTEYDEGLSFRVSWEALHRSRHCELSSVAVVGYCTG
jgi:hypothetical protein